MIGTLLYFITKNCYVFYVDEASWWKCRLAKNQFFTFTIIQIKYLTSIQYAAYCMNISYGPYDVVHNIFFHFIWFIIINYSLWIWVHSIWAFDLTKLSWNIRAILWLVCCGSSCQIAFIRIKKLFWVQLSKLSTNFSYPMIRIFQYQNS